MSSGINNNDSNNSVGGVGSNSKTIIFDVGGTIYRVSRSLLEEHPESMLARMVSDAWLPAGDDFMTRNNQEEPGNNDIDSSSSSRDCTSINTDSNKKNTDNPPPLVSSLPTCPPQLFIKRDGERFRYVLDYMRDGGVVDLPQTVSRNAFLQDLTYYGFHDVNGSKIGSSVFRSETYYIDNLRMKELAEWCFKGLNVGYYCNDDDDEYEGRGRSRLCVQKAEFLDDHYDNSNDTTFPLTRRLYLATKLAADYPNRFDKIWEETWKIPNCIARNPHGGPSFHRIEHKPSSGDYHIYFFWD